MTIPVAIIGTGNIARDLFRKVSRSPVLELLMVTGRNKQSDGLEDARKFAKMVSADSIDAIVDNKDKIKIVFDTTSANAHRLHYEILSKEKIQSIDLTPSGCGKVIVPAVNLSECLGSNDISLVSCGGQSSIPIIFSLVGAARDYGCEVDYVEVSSSISSLSAGPATRINLDNYILHTQEAIKNFSGCSAKVILNINPAIPPINMQSSISIRLKIGKNRSINWSEIVTPVANNVKEYVPGYDIVVAPSMIGDDRLFASVIVKGRGDYLPSYAGNLDIITSAAIRVSEYMAESL